MNKSNPPFPGDIEQAQEDYLFTIGFKVQLLAVILTEGASKNNKRGAAL
jgi:hypothetical protein